MSKTIAEAIDSGPARRRFLTAVAALPVLALPLPPNPTAALRQERSLASLTAAELRRPHNLAG